MGSPNEPEISPAEARVVLDGIRDRVETITGIPLTRILFSHPVMVFTACFFLFVSVGYAAEKARLDSLGIDVAAFAEVDDLVLAAFKNLFYVGICALCILTYALLHFYLDNRIVRFRQSIRNNIVEERKNVVKGCSTEELNKIDWRYGRHFKDFDKCCFRFNMILMVALVVTGITPFFVTGLTTNSPDRQIPKPNYNVHILLRTGHTLPAFDSIRLKFLTATERYIFLKQACVATSDDCTDSTLSIPSASITSMAHIHESQEQAWRDEWLGLLPSAPEIKSGNFQGESHVDSDDSGVAVIDLKQPLSR